MLKPGKLRNHLTAWVPALAADPDKLHILIPKGRILTTGTPALGFRYDYTLNLIITDWSGDTDQIMVPILTWLQVNQPDAVGNPDKQADCFVFEAEILNNNCFDLSIELKLSERVTIRDLGNGTLETTHPPEPTPVEYGWVP